MVNFSLASSLLTALPLAMAKQDNSFYSRWYNPNVNDEQYYKDAINVLQDIDQGQFSALHIHYHGCV
jgi:hypothetical protein